MAFYKILWKNSASHDLRNLDTQFIRRIMKALEALCGDPFPAGSKKLKDSSASYRVRVGDFRVVYQVDSTEKLITIFHVRHRKDVYKR